MAITPPSVILSNELEDNENKYLIIGDIKVKDGNIKLLTWLVYYTVPFTKESSLVKEIIKEINEEDDFIEDINIQFPVNGEYKIILKVRNEFNIEIQDEININILASDCEEIEKVSVMIFDQE